MKIKVVDMPYEQALAQPREKHTPPRRPFMLVRARPARDAFSL